MTAEKTICDVCGREVAQTNKRGRPRYRHRECSKMMAQLASFERLLDEIRFAPGDAGNAKVKRLRGHIQGEVLNQRLRTATVKRSVTSRSFISRRS